MEKIGEQIKTQFYRAFDDLLTQSLSGDSPDWSWLVRLYGELRDRIFMLTPRRSDIREELEENMDVELFEQMISNGAFRAQEMWNLVTYVFELLKTREAPARNESTTNIVQELHSIFSADGVTIATFVPIFLRKAHQKIDEIEKDKQEFLKQFKK